MRLAYLYDYIYLEGSISALHNGHLNLLNLALSDTVPLYTLKNEYNIK